MPAPAIKALKVLFAALVVVWSVGAGNCWSAIIKGTITHNEFPVGHALEVQLWQLNPETLIYDHVGQTSYDPATGQYEFKDLSDGSYLVYVLDLTGEFAAEIYQDAYRQDQATVVEIKDGVALIDPVDIAVQHGAMISGLVRDSSGTPIPYIAVGIEEMRDLETMELVGGTFGVSTATNGGFKVGLRPGIYTVSFLDYSDNPYWATQQYSNTVAHQWATPIVLTSVGQSTININATLQPGYDISGTVTDKNGVKLAGVFASFEVYDPARMEWGTSVSKRTDENAFYSVNFPPGQYRVYFDENSRLYEQEYWSNAVLPASAASVNLSSSSVGGIDAQLEHTPLARWAFSYGLDPFADLEGWLNQDPDADTYDNFHEFAFGTDPTNPSSGNPIQINPPRRLPVGMSPQASNTVTFSALFHQNLSTAYWLQYELQYKTNLLTPGWASEYLGIPHVLPSDPVSYIELRTNVPTTPDPNKFYRLRATINTY